MMSLLITENEKNRIRNLHKNYSFGSLLNEVITPDILKQKYVDNGKVLLDTFEEIMNVSNNKINYAGWLTKMVANDIILPEDVYKYDEYFKIFNQSKQHFQIKDINQIKTNQELEEWLSQVFKFKERDVTKSDPKISPKNYVSSNDIKNLEDVGIEYMGMVNGYQAFKIPSSQSFNENTWKAYRDILGKCQGREQGEKIELCTVADFKSFSTHTSRGPLFLFFNMGDKKSPYQFSYHDIEFKDKDNIDIPYDYELNNLNLFKLFEFIQEKEGYPIPIKLIKEYINYKLINKIPLSDAEINYMSRIKKSEEIIFKTLDNQKLHQIKIDDRIYFVKNIDDKYAWIRFNKSDGWCGISDDLLFELSDLTQFKFFEVQDFIVSWVENTLQMKVTSNEILDDTYWLEII